MPRSPTLFGRPTASTPKRPIIGAEGSAMPEIRFRQLMSEPPGS
jgi:hypothetical protein